MDFSEEQLERYSRHIILKDVSVEGQIEIMKAKVLIIGAGGLGSPAALYLAAECLKYITHVGELLTNALLIFNAKTMDFRKVKIHPNKDCSICGDNPTIVQLRDEQQPVCDFNVPG